MVNISIKQSSMIRPARELPNKHLWLSNLDLIHQTSHHLPIYIYNSNNRPFHTQLLKHALSKVLLQFYPVAGRLERDDKGRLGINCNGDGVLFIDAETESTIQGLGDLLLNEEVTQLIPRVDSANNNHISSLPLLVLQVTKFGCGGVSVGMQWHHLLSDGSGFINFAKTWYGVARGLHISNPPFIDRTILRNQGTPKFQHLEWDYLPPISNTNSTQNNTKTEILKITPKQLEVLKSHVEENYNGKTKYSSYEVLTAHIWRCTCKARGLTDDQEVKLNVAVDGRSRFKPQLPTGYFGNAIFLASSIALSGDIVSEPLKKTIERIRKAKNRMDDEYLRSSIAYLEGFDDITPIIRGPHVFQCPNLLITSWMKIPFYSLDFGMGKPIYFRRANPDEGKGYILQTPSHEIDGSWALIISLQLHHMESFKNLFYNDFCEIGANSSSPEIITSKM